MRGSICPKGLLSGEQLVFETTESCTADFAKASPRAGSFFIALAVAATRDFMPLLHAFAL